MITYKLHLIRHGVTAGNAEGRFIGRTDLPVSEEGFDELARLRDTYDYPRVGAVYTSPLRRCIQTAEFLYPNSLLTVVDGLQEMDFGAFEGKTIEELEGEESFGRWLADSAHNAPPDGETGLQMAERLVGAVSEVLAHMMQNRITSAAVVTHAGVINTLLSLCGFPQAWFHLLGGDSFFVSVLKATRLTSHAIERTYSERRERREGVIAWYALRALGSEAGVPPRA